jgi:hypothetical protein
MIYMLSRIAVPSRTLAAAAVIAVVGYAAPAAALVLTPTSVGLGVGDVGQSFTIFFDGNVEGNPVAGLTSKVTFTFSSITAVAGNRTELSFAALLENTSSGGVGSRTSAIGFNTDPNLLGVGTASGTGRTRVSGLFPNDRSGAFPNGFGAIELCVTAGPTCQGGASGGAVSGTGPQAFNLILAISGPFTGMTLDNFGARYQSITGASAGTSGTGRGTVDIPPVVIPEPTTLAVLGLGLLGLGLVLGRRTRPEPAIA